MYGLAGVGISGFGDMCGVILGSSLAYSAGAKTAVSGGEDKGEGVFPRVGVPASCSPKSETVGRMGISGSLPPIKSMLEKLLVYRCKVAATRDCLKITVTF